MGFTMTIPGAITANKGFIQQFATVQGKAGMELDASHVGLWSGISLASQVVFQGISPFLAARFGLKFNMYCLTGLVLLAIVLEIVASEWKVYLVAKIMCGFAAGFIATTITTYISEITTPAFRGIHLAFFSFAFALGQLFSSIALEVLEKTKPLAYKNAFYSEFVIVGIWIPIMLFLPESPVWYCKNGRDDQAMRSLRRLVGNVPGYDYEHEYAVLKQEVAESEVLASKSSSMSWLACFKGTNLRRTIVSTIPFTMQNFCGSPLMFNAPYFLSTIGMDNAFTANLIVMCVLLFGVLISFYLIDKAGRRPLLLGGGLVMCVTVFIVGAMGQIGIAKGTGTVMIVMMALWVFAFALSCGPIGWSSLVEHSTPVLRTHTAGIATIMQSCSGVLFSYTIPLMLSPQYAGWGAKIGFFFGPLALLSTVVVYFTVPETKGRNYQELDELYERRLPAWRFKDAVTTYQLQVDKDLPVNSPSHIQTAA